jgi:hypothetical protein
MAEASAERCDIGGVDAVLAVPQVLENETGEIFGCNDIWGADTIRNGTSSLDARAICINMRHTVERYLAGVDRAPQRNRIRTADRPHGGVASASNDLYRSGVACHRGQRFRLLGTRPLVASMTCFRLTN